MTDAELLEAQRRLQRQRGIDVPEHPPDNAAAVAGMIDMVAAVAERGAERETEYMGPDGLLRCTACNGPRQTIITPPFEGAKPRTVRCWCSCPTAQDRAREVEKRVLREQRLAVCFAGMEDLKKARFEADDGLQNQDLVADARAYASQFPHHLRENNGLLYYGPVGTGKTFLAACIANAVIDQGYKVRMTNFSTVADELWSAKEKATYIADLCNYPLLILDDLGVERKSEYMQEMVYKVINARYASGKPVIITTNLTPDELTKADEMGYARTYDRLIETCTPVNVGGRSRRRAAAARNWTSMREQLRGGATE